MGDLGKEEASGSPEMSALPRKEVMISPDWGLPTGLIKESCFSAVVPVRGWNLDKSVNRREGRFRP